MMASVLMLVVTVSVQKAVGQLLVAVRVDPLHEEVELRLQGSDSGKQLVVIF